MKTQLKALAAGAMLLASSYAAASINIGGLTVPVGTHFENGTIYENIVTGVGQTLTGYGEVFSINDQPVTTLCNGCELTYVFGGYKVTSITPTSITFSGGYVNFYLGFGANNDLNPSMSSGSAADFSAASNGTLFLTLAGHAIDAAGNTFAGTGNNIGSQNPGGTGSGLGDIDVTGMMFGNTVGAGAIANSNFNTNSIASLFGGFADFLIGSTFSTTNVPHSGECGPTSTAAGCLRGSADFRGLVIPEPDSLALLGLGVAALSLGLRRRKAK